MFQAISPEIAEPPPVDENMLPVSNGDVILYFRFFNLSKRIDLFLVDERINYFIENIWEKVVPP